MLHKTICNDDFLAQHSVTTLLRHRFERMQHCSNILTLRCNKNRRCESSRVTSPLSSLAIFAKGFMTGTGVESGGISYDVYLDKNFVSVYFGR